MQWLGIEESTLMITQTGQLEVKHQDFIILNRMKYSKLAKNDSRFYFEN